MKARGFLKKNRFKKMLVYDKDSGTLRQMPENYMVAYWDYRWLCEPDLACDEALVVEVFKLLFKFEYKYGSGERIVEQITK